MARTLTNLLFHVVFSTKNRRGWIDQSFEGELHDYMGGIIRNLGGTLLEINGTSNHVHILVQMKPTHTLSVMVGKVKANSSKWLNEQRRMMLKFGWQDGYGAFTVSESMVEVTRKYVRNQKEHHRKMTFEEEFERMLRANQIEFSPEHLFEEEPEE